MCRDLVHCFQLLCHLIILNALKPYIKLHGTESGTSELSSLMVLSIHLISCLNIFIAWKNPFLCVSKLPFIWICSSPSQCFPYVFDSYFIPLFFLVFVCFVFFQTKHFEFPVNWISQNVILKLATWRSVVTLVLLRKVLSLRLWTKVENTGAWLPYTISGCPGVKIGIFSCEASSLLWPVTGWT